MTEKFAPSVSIKYGFDVGSLGIVAATLTEWLPAVASLLSVVWVTIRIYETDTVQKLIRWMFPNRSA